MPSETTRERILREALRLFARSGYEAATVEQIARAVGIKAPSLYKHFPSKRAILEGITRRMAEYDAEQARAADVPQETRAERPEAYETVSMASLAAFSRAMVRHWTQEEFPRAFRRLLTLEQFSSGRMAELYQQYLCAGPLAYTRDLFAALTGDEAGAMGLALEFYGALFLFFSAWDGAEDKDGIIAQADAHIDRFARRMEGSDTYMNGDIVIRPERESDWRAVEELVRDSFWNVYRPGCMEHYLLHELRSAANFVRELDFVMEKSGRIIGQNAFTRAIIRADDGRSIPVLTMGPISIASDLKRRGYGRMLLDYSLEAARRLGYGAVCFEGNIAFYGGSGFVPASSRHIHYEGEPRESEVPYFLLKELIPGYLDGVEGVFIQPMAAYLNPEAAEAFDAQFPPREKKRLPGQLE